MTHLWAKLSQSRLNERDTAKGKRESCATQTQIHYVHSSSRRETANTKLRPPKPCFDHRRNKSIPGGGRENTGMEFCKAKSQAKGGEKNTPNWEAAAHLLDVSLREVEDLVPDLRHRDQRPGAGAPQLREQRIIASSGTCEPMLSTKTHVKTHLAQTHTHRPEKKTLHHSPRAAAAAASPSQPPAAAGDIRARSSHPRHCPARAHLPDC